MLIIEGTQGAPEAPKIRHITNRAFLARLADWWPFIEYLRNNSAAFRLDWTLLELAGYVDLDAPENHEAFQRLGQAIDALRAEPTFNETVYPEFSIVQITTNGTEREAYRGEL